MPISLWLCPPSGSHVQQSLEQLIQTFASIIDVFREDKSPVFPAHLTITNDVSIENEQEISQKLGDLTKLAGETAIEFEGVDYRGSYFVAVPLACHQTDSLLALATKARQILVGDDEIAFLKSYRPHVSLAYTNVDPIPTDARSYIEGHVLKLLQYTHGWNGGRLVLMKCEGPVDSWTALGHKDII